MKRILIILFIILSVGCTDKVNYIDNPNDKLALVNKKNKLKKNFIPKDLIKLDLNYSHDEKYLKKEAALSFYELSKAARKKGYIILAVSGYRSYTYQKKLYKYYVKEKGSYYASKCSALPGHSEHQTGLALDVEGSNKDYNKFEETKEFKWMIKNCYKYGFILRYPKGKENITGFKYEPWHYRYVGKKASKYIYKHNLTLEEYIK